MTTAQSHSGQTDMTVDMLCRSCHYNLRLCQVESEEKYHLRIIRCPKCGEVNSVDSFPVQGPWPLRIRQFTAVIWFHVVVSAYLCTSLMIGGFSAAISEQFSRDLSRRLRDDTVIYAQDKYPNHPSIQNVYTLADEVFPEWWASVGEEEYLASIGGRFAVLGWDEIAECILLVLFCFFAGIILALLFWQKRASTLLILGVVTVSLIMLVSIPILVIDQSFSKYLTIRDVGRNYIDVFGFCFTSIVSGSAFILGMLCGLPVVRAVVRALLPHARRRPLVSLWSDFSKPIPASNLNLKSKEAM